MKKMSKRLGMSLCAALIATTVMTGCNKKDGDTAAKPATKTEKKAELFSEWKPAEVLEKIQGTYKVEGSTWEVKGDKVTVTSRTKTNEATLDLSRPCEVKVKVALPGGGFSSDNYSITINGDDVYIGMGTMGMKVGEKYIVNENGIVTFDGKECNYYKEIMMGPEKYEQPKKVKGEVTEKDGKKVFSFEVPNRYKPGEVKSYSVEVVGNALLNEQAKDNLIKK